MTMSRLFSILLILSISLLQAKPFTSIQEPLAAKGRPVMDNSYESSNRHFLLHYNNLGTDAVPQVYDRGQRTPDFILYAAEYFEKSFSYLSDTLGFSAPPIDDASSPTIDAYFSDLGNGYYGMTQPEYLVSSTARRFDYTGYMAIDNDFIGSGFYTKGYDALAVTCAHELFHIFQIGYNLWDFTDDEIWFFEASSSWIEDQVFPDVNDYFQYVNTYAYTWGQSIDSYYYYNVTWVTFLNARDPHAVLSIWENILTENVWNSLTDYLNIQFSTPAWPNALAEWGVNHVISPESSLFPDAAQFTEIRLLSIDQFYLSGDQAEILYYPDDYSNTFKVFPDLPAGYYEMWTDAEAASIRALSGTSITPVKTRPVLLKMSTTGNLYLSVGTGENSSTGSVTIYLRKAWEQFVSLNANPARQSSDISITYILQDEKSDGTFRFYNILGQQVDAVPVPAPCLIEGNITCSLPYIPLSSGIYFVNADIPGLNFTAKFTIIK